ncbi:LanC-like protein 2 [Trichinella patagoniensis]|uniref:RNA-directed DNA polymerase n=1 Tax=Trichinella patagoniensis TaxID=990121 RepID=A0A0V0ZE23_9BILA|nr:LanC-like protein 2 [Trichinella patagoniensis]
MLGHIEEFDIYKPKEWTAYASHLIFFLEANNVTDPARRRAVLLSSCGGAVFNLIQAFISPANPNEKSFDEILFVLEEHFSPQPCEIVKRNAFYKRNQKIGESISDFVADLRRLAQGCNFSDLEIMLRDRLVIGLRDEELQLRLFFRKNLTFESALEEALSAEAAAQHTREVRASDNTSSNVYQIQARTAKQATICQSCGGTHIRSQCRFRNARCRACQKVGHIAKVCSSKANRQRKTNFKHTANSLASVDKLASRFPDSLLLNNLRPSAKCDQSCMSSRKIRGELVKVKGSYSVNVQYGNIHRILTLIVAKGHCPNLLGLNWFEPLGIHLSGVHHLMSTPPQISEVLRKYQSVFTEELGMYVGKPVSLDLDPNVTPICMKARKVPFALREKIDAELDNLVDSNRHTPVKSDGTVRICGNYKCTINKALRKHTYPIPAVNQLLASLSGGKVFAKLDLAQAYQQLTVDDATADAQTIITHRGAFRVKRLQFGISAAPGIFQNVIDKTVAGIQGVLPYFDDILIAASDEKELANRLETVLHRFAKAGLRLKADKCKFCLPRVEFLGFEVDATGIHPAKANLSSTQEIPIAFYSRTLSATERNYAQIDKEALAVIAGVKKFHEYLYGRQFTIITDHKPLLGLFVPKKETPQILSPRILRWSILLNAYDYTINYRPGKEIANADALSRLPKQSTENNGSHNPVILLLETIDNSPLHSKDIARITAKDPILTRVLSWAWREWPKLVSDERLKPYVTRQHEISFHNGIAHRHPGIVQMKALARRYVWWPKMDSEIENLWESPRIPWSRIHVDLAGPIYGKNFLIVVDAFSKWLEVRVMKNTTSESVISCLRQIFSIHGLPDIIVSDNGTQFTSHIFQDKGGIKHITSAPFHPSSNGQAERMVRTTKEFIKKMTQRDWEYNLTNVLFCQHVTPCTTTGKIPNELLMNRRLRTVLDRLQPDVVPEDLDKKFEKFLTLTGPLFYQVQTEDGQLWRRHIDQLRKRYVTGEQNHSAERIEAQEDETGEKTVEAIPDEDTQQLSQHLGKKLRQRHHHLLVKVLDNRDRLREKEDRHNGSETTNVYAYRNIYKKNAQEHITVVSTSPVSVRRCVSAFARCALFLWVRYLCHIIISCFENLMDGRSFANNFEDYCLSNRTQYLSENGETLNDHWSSRIRDCIYYLTPLWINAIRNESENDFSVYTGISGYALLYYHLYQKLNDDNSSDYLTKAVKSINMTKRWKTRTPTFLCGTGGSYAIEALVHRSAKQDAIASGALEKLIAMANETENEDLPDELLYGRSGYLYSLMLVRKEFGNFSGLDAAIAKVVDEIYRSGIRLGNNTQCKLLYKWHGTYYLGAAHGLAGILFTLMRTPNFCENVDLKSAVEQTIDYLITLRFPSGNYPSSLGKETDKLVHWCHGAPGFIHMFIQAYAIYGKEEYFKEAVACADVIWARGLLKKGYGLCHGTAGNGYAFLAMYQLTDDLKYLHRALKFAEWIFDYGKHGCRIADRPYSLYEGLAGTIYYLVDLLKPKEAAFPGFY